MKNRHQGFEDIWGVYLKHLTDKAEFVDVGTWHAQDVRGQDHLISKEVINVNFQYYVPTELEALVKEVKPNLPWAEDHFQERVGGKPLNPPPSESYWPFAQQSNQVHKEGQIFAHTYPERYWPRYANVGGYTDRGRQIHVPHIGIRFEYGDLQDVVNLLIKQPQTRQAYLPVWFPEDTGAVEGQRVPCSIGYHFMIRQGTLNCTYFIRSCDFLRHFRDDVYMTCRLMQWVANQFNEAKKNENLSEGIVWDMRLTMQIASLHVFKGDTPMMNKLANELDEESWQGI